MNTKSTLRENFYAPGTSRNRETGVTLRLAMARDETGLLEMGLRIKELRESHGFKQQWIADQIGVTLRTYQFWQAGTSAPDQENLTKLAALFNVTPKHILKGETPPLLSDRADQLARIEDTLAIILGVLERQVGADILEAVRQDMQQAPPPAASTHPSQAA